ncbi:hypothetical protein B0H12DRAFT_1111638 [Mycena haematopus]|nr:hypothetical protein B0H12DRAFT_1111638 [Mycena haematopus]
MDPVFPQELFDAVIDHLADDLETLRSCALVSPSFYARASGHIFSRLQVGPLDRNHSIYEFYKLLEGSPSLAASAKSLHIRQRSPGYGSRWQIASPADRFLSLLVSLARLCITIDGKSCSWDRIPKALRGSIDLTLARPTFTCLKLTNVSGLPFTLLSHCPALRSLTLKWVTFAGKWRAATAACVGSRPAQLEHLSLQLDIDLLAFFARWIRLPESPLDISGLRVLECPAYLDDFTIQPLLSVSASTLQRLYLSDSQMFSMSGTLDLREFAHLHTLSVNIRRRSFIGEDMHVISLRHIIFPPLPQPLALVFHLCPEYAYSGSAAEWFIGADRALAAFSFITSVTVILSPWFADKRERPTEELIDASAEFVQKMPLLVKKLAGRGVLRVLRSSYM